LVSEETSGSLWRMVVRKLEVKLEVKKLGMEKKCLILGGSMLDGPKLLKASIFELPRN
jgi:hypothetical protein